MCGHVPLETAAGGEGAEADGRLVEARARVRPLVAGERTRRDETPVNTQTRGREGTRSSHRADVGRRIMIGVLGRVDSYCHFALSDR